MTVKFRCLDDVYASTGSGILELLKCGETVASKTVIVAYKEGINTIGGEALKVFVGCERLYGGKVAYVVGVDTGFFKKC